MKLRGSALKVGVLVAFVIAIAAGATAYDLATEEAQAGLALCSPKIECLDVWDPVICDNGQVYSNFCYARRACATGCVPLGSQTE